MGMREAAQPNKHWFRRTDRGARGPLAAFMPLATLFLCQLTMLQSFPDTWAWMMDCPWAAVLTYVVLLLAELLMERLTTSLLLGAAATFLPCFLLAVASHLKLAVNGVPLLYSDLSMIGQAAEVAGFLSPDVGLGTATWQAIGIAAVLFFLAFLWDRPVVKVPWWQRLLTAAGVAVALVATLTLPAAGALLDDREAGESQAERNQRLGVLAGMYAAARHNALVEPDEYTEDNMNRILLQISAGANRVSTPEVKPNVVVLLSESFFDPTRLPNVSYSTDPIPNYHALAQTFPAGEFLTCAFSGGTGVAEMEILTGVSTNILAGEENMTTISSPGAYERVPSLVRAFKAQGYQTTYVHSHTNALYSRTEHMPAIGFDQVLFMDDFTQELRYEGYYVSDDCWADELIAQFEAKEEDTPIFLFGMSMENHQPFRLGKFSDPSPVEITTDLIPDETDMGVFDALIHGLYDADAALGKLVDYFSQVDEPTILVFMGDHLPRPNFDVEESDTLFDRLGYSTTADTLMWGPEELKYMLSTNYLVWNNYGADLDGSGLMSTISVSTRLLDWAGLPKPLYYSWMDTLLDQVAIYRDRLFITAQGEAYSEIPAEYKTLMKRYETIIYDTLYGENFITEALTGSKVRQTTSDSMPEVVSPPLNDDEDDPEVLWTSAPASPEDQESEGRTE